MQGSLCDVNQAGGGMNVADVVRMVGDGMGANSTFDDLNMDGKVNVVDVQIAVNAMGGTCMAK